VGKTYQEMEDEIDAINICVYSDLIIGNAIQALKILQKQNENLRERYIHIAKQNKNTQGEQHVQRNDS
jgi:hypothetical protein